VYSLFFSTFIIIPFASCSFAQSFICSFCNYLLQCLPVYVNRNWFFITDYEFSNIFLFIPMLSKPVCLV
jgi:hypothetical protein